MPGSIAEPRSARSGGPGPSRILIVEDEPSIAELLRLTLANAGFEPTVVRDGDRATTEVRTRRYHAVVLDIMLPGKDGLTVLQDIRSSEGTRQLPVVLLTARADQASTWTGWERGCDYYLTKPFDPPELVSVVRRLVSFTAGSFEDSGRSG